MEQILVTYGLPKETNAAIIMLYKNMKVKVHSPDGDTDDFNIVTGVLQEDTLASIPVYYDVISSSSSSSYRAGSTDIPDPLSPLLPIVHRPR